MRRELHSTSYRKLVKRLLDKDLIRQDGRDRVSWSPKDATFSTSPHMGNGTLDRSS